MFEDKDEKTQKLLFKEPDFLSKLTKFKHPNLQSLVTWFKDPHGFIVSIIEYKKGKNLLKFVEDFKNKKELISFDDVMLIFS